MTADDIATELETLRIASNSPKVGLFSMRRIYRRRAELFALLAELEREGTNDGTMEAR